MDDHFFAELAHHLAHDVSAPLSGVAMLLTAAQRRPAADAALLGDSLGALQRVRTLLRAFVDFADAGDPTTARSDVDLGELAREAAAALPRGSVTCSGDFPQLRGNRRALALALQALLDNAARYSAPGQVEVQVVGVRNDDGWRIEVRDRGLGIDAEDCARVLAPWVRLHPFEEIPGCGLGLATASRAIAGHGGRLGLMPRDGGGAIAWFTLPAA